MGKLRVGAASVDITPLLGGVGPKDVGRLLLAIHDTLGAPGDWGYETRLGRALGRLYQATDNGG